MSVGVEDKLQAGIVAALTADAAVAALASSGVHAGRPGQDTPPPYVTVDVMTAEDAHTFAGRAFTICLVEIRGVVEHRGAGTPLRVVELAEAIRLAVDAPAVLTVAGLDVSPAQRVQRIGFDEPVDGATRFHRGGVYRVMAQPA